MRATARQLERAPAVDPTAAWEDIYGMLCIGACMAPAVPDGSSVAASKTEPLKVGGIVAVWLHPDVVKPGGKPGLIKRLSMGPWPGMKFPHRDSLKSTVRPIVVLSMDAEAGHLQVLCSDILALHTVIGVKVPGGEYYQPVGGYEGRALR